MHKGLGQNLIYLQTPDQDIMKAALPRLEIKKEKIFKKACVV